MLWARALFVGLLVVGLIRFLGRDLQFQARPYDQAVQVLLGSAAANLIVEEDIPLWSALAALATLVVLHVVMSFLSLWNPMKKFLVGTPDVVIENGQILKANLIKHQVSVEELMAGLREKGFHNLYDVEFAMLEASGRLSVIPRSQSRPVTPRDLHLETQYEGFTSMLISDGAVNRQGLEKLGLDESWLMSQIEARGASSFRDVLVASLDSQGEFFMVRNQDVPFLQAIFKGVQVQTTPGLPPMVATDGHPPH